MEGRPANTSLLIKRDTLHYDQNYRNLCRDFLLILAFFLSLFTSLACYSEDNEEGRRKRSEDGATFIFLDVQLIAAFVDVL